MNWNGVVIQAIMLAIFLLWEGFFKQKAKNLADKNDIREISYEQEMGKRLATKDDIDEVTCKMEEIKNMYASSLERYRFELQKEFETSKYIINLCNTIDLELIKYIAEALNSHHSQGIGPESDNEDIKLISSACKISDFLYTYKARYGYNNILKKLRDTALDIKITSELEGAPVVSDKIKDVFLSHLNSAVSLFLPKFK